VLAGDASAREPPQSSRGLSVSVDAVQRFLEVRELLPRFYLSPQGHRPPLLPANRLEAIVFDHSLDRGKAIAGVGVADWHHPASVLPAATATLSPIARCPRLHRTGGPSVVCCSGRS
jgi:hypothetical protein